LTLWIDPDAPVPLDILDYTSLILAEGLALFFCFFLTCMVIQVARALGGRTRRAGGAELVMSALAATFWGAVVATFEGGMTTMTLYCGLLIVHLLWLGQASLDSAVQEARLQATAFMVYLACGVAAAIVRLPRSSKPYPPTCIDCDLTFDLPAQNVLAFAFLYFMLAGMLNLFKDRLFALPATHGTPGIQQ